MKYQQTLVEVHIFSKINNEINFLLLKRAETEKYPNIWQPITGSINEDEKAYETALRELYEETGIKLNKLFVVPTLSGFYSYENDYISLIPVFAVLVEKDILIKLSHEHCCYKWVGYREALEMVSWEDQRKSMRLINEHFTKEKSNLKFIEIKL